MILERMEQDSDSKDALGLHDLKESLLTHICTENKAFFKSQQIDDPELDYEERKQIATEMLDQSRLKFLQRFGANLKKEHLKYFESENPNSTEHDEVKENLRQISWNLDHHGTIVRNRRYTALVKLIKDKKYFAEAEMKSRDPLLYEQLIGQYQSPEEKRANRRPDPTTDTLVDILLEGIDHNHDRDVANHQRVEEEEDMMSTAEDDSQEKSDPKSDDDDDEDSCHHQQWGNFEEPQASTSTSQPRTRKRPAKLITAGERDLLKEEFLGIMYSNFLSGKDLEFFDYSTVDTNEEYDDALENDQDCEEKYFDEDSEDAPPPAITNDDSEDELDIYMKHLEKNLNQQQQQHSEEFEEEFDD